MTKVNITEREIIESLAQLRSIRVRDEFKDYLRKEAVYKLPMSKREAGAMPLIWRWALAAVILGLVTVPGVIYAAQESQPGELLYPVKELWQEVKSTLIRESADSEINENSPESTEEEVSKEIKSEEEEKLPEIKQSTPLGEEKSKVDEIGKDLKPVEQIVPTVSVIEEIIEVQDEVKQTLDSVVEISDENVNLPLDQLPIGSSVEKIDEVLTEISPLLKISL